MPKSISDGGFATDGAWHIDQDASDEAKITWDRTRHNPNVVLHKPMFLSGTVGSETDHLIGHWKCDDNAASTTIVDETGTYNGTLQGGDNTEDKDQTDAVRGTSLLLNGTDDYLDFSSALAGLTDEDKFTVIIKFKPNFAYTTSTYHRLLHIGYDSEENIEIRYNTSSDFFEINDEIGGGGDDDAISPAFSSDEELQQWHTVMLSVDTTKDTIHAVFNNTVTHLISTGEWIDAVTYFHIGTGSGAYMPVYIDEVKLLDGCVLPYGAYFTGNGAVDTDVAHEDITFYLDFEGANETARLTDKINSVAGTVTGSGVCSNGSAIAGSYGYDNVNDTSEVYFPITNQNIISHEQGSLGMWFNVQAYGDDYVWGFRATGDSTNQLFGYLDENGGVFRFHFRYEASDVAVTLGDGVTRTMTTGVWYWIECVWKHLDFAALYINGILIESASLSEAWDGGTTYDNLYFCAGPTAVSSVNAFIDQIYITNNPYTPQIWTAFGTPLHVPLLEVT